jgi:hypothetical protein
MNAYQVADKMVENRNNVVHVDSSKKFKDLVCSLLDKGYVWHSNDGEYYGTIEATYGDKAVIGIDVDGKLSYADTDYFDANGYTILEIDEDISLLSHVLSYHLGVKDGDTVNIIYDDDTEDTFNPYTLVNDQFIDRDGDEIDSDVVGHLVMGTAHCAKYTFPKNDGKVFYVNCRGRIAELIYNDLDPLCRALKAMGNVFSTRGKATQHVDEMVEKYNK